VGAVRTAPSTSTVNVPIESIRSHVAVVEPEAESIFHGALFLYLVAKEAKRLRITPVPEETQRAAERFRRARGLLTAKQTHEWLERNHTGQEEFTALMELVALVEAVLARHENGVDAFLPAELKRRGAFEFVSTAILEKRSALDKMGLKFPSPEDAGTTSTELVAWYEQRFRRFDAPFEEHRRSRGVPDRGRFMREVLAEFIRERHASTSGVGAHSDA
jgi:hypothetical protein